MMSNIDKIARNIDLKSFRYELPDSKIAKYPLVNRSESKLLVYNSREIQHQHFYDIKQYLPHGSTLFFNNTKVIPARLHFNKDSGAKIEIFLLAPKAPHTEVTQAMTVKGMCQWQCMIGNRKRWKLENELTRHFETDKGSVSIKASFANYEENIIQFSWDNQEITFVEIVEFMGTTPLPPYLNREAEDNDKPRYQTVYSKNEGAVAAPTAGLHFTDEIMEQLSRASHQMEYLTLHVGAGTFQPLKSENVLEHPMHNEQIVIDKKTIHFLANSKSPIIAVGTTSVRSLESAYWFGVQLIEGEATHFQMSKLYAYERGFDDLPSRQKAFHAVSNFLDEQELDTLYGETEIFIFPGYKFQVISGLITNFHQPESTLILLIAALLGNDWKKVYEEALNKNYRFLSYGDSSLLIP